MKISTRSDVIALPDLVRDDRSATGIDELRHETTELAIYGVLGLAFCVLAFGAFGLNDVGPQLFSVVAGLSAVGLIARALHPRWPTLAAAVVVAGLVVVSSMALVFLPGLILAPWFALAVLLAGALLGWRWGVTAAAVAAAILLVAAWRLPAPIPGEVAVSAILLSGANLFAAWLLTRPTRIALDWAWNSYVQAHQQTAVARERQAELARLSKGLSESYYQLEQLNLELERARRAEREARRLKAEFAAAVSHELRTPLNLIIGFCEMMVLSPSAAYGQHLPANYQHDLEAIYRNACHISALVDDILDLSQIDADRMALHRDWISLEKVIEEAVATVDSLFRDRELTIRTVVVDDLPCAFVDQTRVRQILINLLGNAARFIDEGGVTIRARRVADHAVISVTDTGPGIPPNEIADVFQEFYQVHGAHPRRGGSGLGLTVSKRFAELHGGSMWVESVLGQGSTFFLDLPLADEVHQGALGGPAWEDRLATRVRGSAERRILVVDESGEVPRVFQRYLDGYQVVRATGFAAARRQLKKEGPIHAVVLGSPRAQQEWNDPRQVPAELAKLPVISCPLHTTRETAESLGVAGYLVKPVTREQLRTALRRLGREIQTALIVDDDDEMTRLLTRMVKSFARRSRCWVAQGGSEALAMLREHRPDVVMLDLLMPETNGYAVLDAIRSDPSLRETPVLVVTARGLQDESVMASALSVARDGGLTVAEVMRWLKSGLDSLLDPNSSAPAPRAGIAS